LLFKTRFHEGIRSGEITMTIRAWQKPQATSGKEYKLGASGRIAVTAVNPVTLSEIRSRDVKASGFSSIDELVHMLRKESRRKLTARSKVYRVRFRYTGERKDEMPTYSRDELNAKLDRMGAWSRNLLTLIADNRGVSSAILAKKMGRERLGLKADVRKLKRLGLTRSLEVGYEITNSGRKMLR
jgi:hypothetical protein